LLQAKKGPDFVSVYSSFSRGGDEGTPSAQPRATSPARAFSSRGGGSSPARSVSNSPEAPAQTAAGTHLEPAASSTRRTSIGSAYSVGGGGGRGGRYTRRGADDTASFLERLRTTSESRRAERRTSLTRGDSRQPASASSAASARPGSLQPAVAAKARPTLPDDAPSSASTAAAASSRPRPRPRTRSPPNGEAADGQTRGHSLLERARAQSKVRRRRRYTPSHQPPRPSFSPPPLLPLPPSVFRAGTRLCSRPVTNRDVLLTHWRWLFYRSVPPAPRPAAAPPPEKGQAAAAAAEAERRARGEEEEQEGHRRHTPPRAGGAPLPHPPNAAATPPPPPPPGSPRPPTASPRPRRCVSLARAAPHTHRTAGAAAAAWPHQRSRCTMLSTT
jgi:hypothetical protein